MYDNMRIFQKGFNYSQDGKGNRLVYHLQGCNMHCPWCSNPEGMDISGGRDYTVEQLINEALECKAMFFDGGGITLTGGEMSVQLETVLEYLKKVHDRGINTAVETNGAHINLSAVFPYVDEMIIDFKHPDNLIHKSATGVGNAQIKENIEKAAHQYENLLIRVPFIHGFNDDHETMINTCQFFASAGVKRVEILPYHEYGRSKWERLGLKYTVENGFITHDTLSRFAKLLDEYNICNINT